MLNGFVMDGVTYDMVTSVKRTAKIESSEASGMLMNRKYHNDPIGTYFEYTVKIAVPIGKEDEYYALYEALTDPVAEHTFILPYSGGTQAITLTARVETISDEYYKQEGIKTLWRKTEFTIISTRPSK